MPPKVMCAVPCACVLVGGEGWIARESPGLISISAVQPTPLLAGLSAWKGGGVLNEQR